MIQSTQDKNLKLEEKISTLINENTMLRKVHTSINILLTTWLNFCISFRIFQYLLPSMSPFYIVFLFVYRSSWTLGLKLIKDWIRKMTNSATVSNQLFQVHVYVFLFFCFFFQESSCLCIVSLSRKLIWTWSTTELIMMSFPPCVTWWGLLLMPLRSLRSLGVILFLFF